MRRAFRRAPWAPLILLSPLVVAGLFGPWLLPHDPTTIDPASGLKPPSWVSGGDPRHLFGTDHAGRDVLSRLIAGARYSLLVAFCGVGIAGLIGVTIGVIAGYARGLADDLVMRVIDMQLAIPPMLLAILIAGVIGGGLTAIIGVIGLTFWTIYARIARGETLSLAQREFVTAAVAVGCDGRRIVFRHIVPHVMSSMIVVATLQVGAAIILESSLTFLGLGIQPPETAWGLMISDSRIYLSTAWWVPTLPGLMIMTTVLGANLLGDWLRDALDPRLRHG